MKRHYESAIYRIKFESHVSLDSGDLPYPVIHSDTLFRIFAAALAELSPDDLDALLTRYDIIFTSAFPYFGNCRFYPVSHELFEGESWFCVRLDSKDDKLRLRTPSANAKVPQQSQPGLPVPYLVSEGILEEICRRQGQMRWIDLIQEGGVAWTHEEAAQFKREFPGRSSDYVWQTGVVYAGVGANRKPIKVFQFHPDGGLYFWVLYRGGKVKNLVQAALSYALDRGIGAGRALGLGKGKLISQSEERSWGHVVLPAGKSGYGIVISSLCPSKEELDSGIFDKESLITLTSRFLPGYNSSVVMLQEGSVIKLVNQDTNIYGTRIELDLPAPVSGKHQKVSFIDGRGMVIPI